MIRNHLRAYQINGFLTFKRQLARISSFDLSILPQFSPIKFRCQSTKSQQEVPEKVLEEMDERFDALQKSKSTSLLKKYLTPDLYQKLRTKRTSNSTLLDCIQSGLINHDSGCGIYAADKQCYQVFEELFNPIIQEFHFGFKATDKHPSKHYGNACIFNDLDPTRNYIASTRIRCARSLEGFPFNPTMTKQNYDDIEDVVQCTMSVLDEEFEGQYYPLLGMDKSVQERLMNDHFLFKPGDKFLRAAKACRYWPVGRGIYFNYAKTFLVWCNEEDHLRIISMQRGGHFGEVYSRLVRALRTIEKKLKFSDHPRLGFLTFCPTNLGTTFRCSVHIRVPKLSQNPERLKEIALKYKLQIRGAHGEHTESEKGIYDISNRRRLGINEFEAVKEIYTGIREIIKLEKESSPSSKIESKAVGANTSTNKATLKDCETGVPLSTLIAKPQTDASKKAASKPEPATKNPPKKEAKIAKKEAPKKEPPLKGVPPESRECPKCGKKLPAKPKCKSMSKPASQPVSKPVDKSASEDAALKESKQSSANPGALKCNKLTPKRETKPTCKPSDKVAAKKAPPKKKLDPKAAAEKCKKLAKKPDQKPKGKPSVCKGKKK